MLFSYLPHFLLNEFLSTWSHFCFMFCDDFSLSFSLFFFFFFQGISCHFVSLNVCFVFPPIFCLCQLIDTIFCLSSLLFRSAQGRLQCTVRSERTKMTTTRNRKNFWKKCHSSSARFTHCHAIVVWFVLSLNAERPVCFAQYSDASSCVRSLLFGSISFFSLSLPFVSLLVYLCCYLFVSCNVLSDY